MMSASRIFRMPSVTSSISKRYMSNVEIVNNKIVLAKLRQVPGKKIMYFNNTWHPLSRLTDPVFAKVSTQYPDIKFIQLDLEYFAAEAAELGVTMVPTLKYFNDGNVVCTLIANDEHRIGTAAQTLSAHVGTLAFPPPAAH